LLSPDQVSFSRRSPLRRYPGPAIQMGHGVDLLPRGITVAAAAARRLEIEHVTGSLEVSGELPPGSSAARAGVVGDRLGRGAQPVT
jgi:hypothetical protein